MWYNDNFKGHSNLCQLYSYYIRNHTELSHCLYIYLLLYLPIYISMSLSGYLYNVPIYLSVCVSINLPIYLYHWCLMASSNSTGKYGSDTCLHLALSHHTVLSNPSSLFLFYFSPTSNLPPTLPSQHAGGLKIKPRKVYEN